MWKKKDRPVDERSLLKNIRELCGELERPLRFLSDVEVVLPHLSEEERKAIVESRAYREQQHARKATDLIASLEAAALQLHSRQTRHVREAVLTFTESWRYQEPDQLKIIVNLLPKDAA